MLILMLRRYADDMLRALPASSLLMLLRELAILFSAARSERLPLFAA